MESYSETDRELVRGVRRGDDGAFEALYRRHKDAVFRFACALSGSVADGEDLLQEAFLGLLRNIDRFDLERPVVPYLLRAVRSRHVDRLRSFASRGRPLSDTDGLTSDEGDPDGLVMADERSAALREALDRLPSKQREALMLRVFGGLGFADIAREQSVPKATVRTRYRAAVDKLRELLGKRITNE